MGYSLSVVNPETGEILKRKVPTTDLGTMQIVGGTPTLEATFDITYNYSLIFMRAFNNEEGIKVLEGMNVCSSINVISSALLSLDMKAHPGPDYWRPTEGNVVVALSKLLSLACEVVCVNPDGIWRIS